MVKFALDAGHSFYTLGKRTPDGEREWTFNNKVLLACIAKLNTYQNVQILRLDDPTGKTDVPLTARVKKANDWKADALVSMHHNAFKSIWGSHGGVETFIANNASKASQELANIINPKIVNAMGLRNRGVKRYDWYIVRYSNMPALLTEGGFMDSTIDISTLRNEEKLKAQGIAIAEGLAEYFKLKPKLVAKADPVPMKKETDEMAERLPKTQQDDMRALLQRSFNDKVFSVNHASRVDTMTRGQAVDLLISYVARTSK